MPPPRVVDLEHLIDLARKGDGELLAEVMRRTMQGRPLPAPLFNFIVDLVAGSIRPRKRKRSMVATAERWWRERRVVVDVEAQMRSRGKQRDKDLRAALTREACEFWGTDALALHRYLTHRRRRLTAKDRKPIRKLATLAVPSRGTP